MRFTKLVLLSFSLIFFMAISSSVDNEIPEHDDGPYLYFCNGVPCQHHDIKKVIKNITPEGIYEYFSPVEMVNLDFDSLEEWQLIRYSHNELMELKLGKLFITLSHELHFI